MTSEILYPPDCLPVSAEQPLKELITGLKNLLLNLQSLEQEGTDLEDNCDEFIPLFRHLSSHDFLSHVDPLVKMTVACCLGQLLRFLPYRSFLWNDKELMVLLNFFVKQLEYFGTSDGNTFKYCVSLLKILNKTEILSKLFMCLEYTTNKEHIYDTFLLTVCEVVCTKINISMVEVHVVQLLQNFISNSKYTSNTGIDIILSSILQENVVKYPGLYRVAVKVIRKCSRALDFPVKMLLFRGLQQDGIPMKTRISGREFEVMFELHHICPTLLVGVWNQLEDFMLGYTESSNKKIALTLLANMFSEENSNFAITYRRLWNDFKNCVNEPSSFGRSLLVARAPKFLVNQPDLCEDIIHILQQRMYDSETTIRFGVVKAINKATKTNLDILQHSALLDILKHSSCDNNEIVRKEALTTLGQIYRRIVDSNSPGLMMKAIWIANTLMHLYRAPYDLNIYIPDIEKVIVKCLVPCDLPVDWRMKKLLQLWCLLDDESRNNFHHKQVLKKRAYECTHQLLSLYQGPPSDELSSKQLEWHREMVAGKLSLTMGNQKEAHHRLLLLTKELAANRKLLSFLQEYANENNFCEDYERLWTENQDIVSYTSERKKRSLTSKRRVLKKESIVLSVKSLCAKLASFLVDEVAMKELLTLVMDCVTRSDVAKDLHIAESTAAKLGIELLCEYFYLMPCLAFKNESTMDQLLLLLTVDDCHYSLPALKIFVTLSSYKPLGEVFPEFVSDHLVPLWFQFATSSTPTQAKLATCCLCSHASEPVISHILTELMKNLDLVDEHYLTKEVAVGHFATHLPNYTDTRCIAYVTEMCHKFVQKSIFQDLEDESSNDVQWYEKDCLPYETKCKVQALKALTRLTVRLREQTTTEKTLSILSKIVENGGAYSNINNLSTATKAWLRLTAGCAFLKICDVPYLYAKQVQKTYFFKMAVLMKDESESVQRLFVKKLCERLMQWEQQRYGLPSMFISYFVLAGTEQDEEVKSFISDALNLCVQDKRQQVWSIMCVTRSRMVILDYWPQTSTLNYLSS
ncbi:sister chromatid cohesion protein PDS5 homolog B-A isoform X3 [Cryptotermes secundus]|uniref:sister chromatid cohesion protein PDS5 homolog B-A isoform X3 n=1 Tax=Cryptotermes secundus TaxID=105785 RepID=UPI000CD7D450|nr:sister chromatid cohesion protein PDS5 homolog B-A isoform X3 [Cryptotermes secundus]